jgi:threonine synthase
MAYRAWFQCIAGCEGRFPLDSVIYRCPRCRDLLEVQHDLEALRAVTPEGWKRLFEVRFMRTEWPYGSGVWGKKEWVAPEIENENVVSMFEGGTNLFWADRLGREIGLPELWVKQCGISHTGSFKDLGMTVLVSAVKQMRRRGLPIQAVACASTGDTSAALAAYCASASIPAVVLLPRGKVSIAQLVQPIANGALVLSLDTDFDGCMALVQRLCESESIYLANSMNSLRIEGQKTVSIEIVQQFDWEVPDFVIVPGGNLGNVSALGKGFQMMLDLGLVEKRPRLVVAQAERANPLYESYTTGFREFHAKVAQPTLASAIQIGNPVSVHKAISVLRSFDGLVEQASEQELADAAARADRTGLHSCPHTAVALAALFKLAARGVIQKQHRTVVISTAHGLKFTDFQVRYHEGRLAGIESHHRNVPVELPPDLGAVREALARHVERTAA